jgi:hypothetical protein
LLPFFGPPYRGKIGFADEIIGGQAHSNVAGRLLASELEVGGYRFFPRLVVALFGANEKIGD